MKKRKSIETSEGLVRAFADLFDEVEPDTPEEIDAVLREAGYDPDEIGVRMKAAAEKALTESPLNWRSRAPKELENERTRIGQVRTTLPGNRAGIIEAIKWLIEQGGNQVAYAYRNLEAMTGEDLASLLSDLEYLASQKRVQDEK